MELVTFTHIHEPVVEDPVVLISLSLCIQGNVCRHGFLSLS
jgi:hypothetical protein